MAGLRPHLAITVTSVERSIPFYEALLGAKPAQVREGWAKFETSEPALNLTLNQGQRNGELGAYNHAGIEVGSTDDVLAARARLRDAGLATFDEIDTECCYARQDKIWVSDPDGTPWEVFTVTGASERRGPGSQSGLGRAGSLQRSEPAAAAHCCSGQRTERTKAGAATASDEGCC